MSLLVFATPRAGGQNDFESGAIKTDYGFLLVWNATNNHYMIEITGKEVRQTSTERVQFNVDGMFLQILTAPISDFIQFKSENDQAKAGRAILEAHRDWEVKFMEGDYKEKLKVESSWQKLSNGKDALVWAIAVPESSHSNVKKQLSLTLVKGDFVLMLGSVVTETIAENVSRQMLMNTAETLKTSDQPIDLRQLQQSFRKAANRDGSADQSKLVTLRGRVFRSDTNKPIPNALLLLLDENRSSKVYNSVGVRTDERGNFTLESVPPSTYTVSIRAWYKTQEDAPCQLLMAKTSDKNSSVIVFSEKDKEGVVQQVFVKGFVIKAGKDISKDFDFACQSMVGN
jgi:hypothetical protein